MARLRGSLEWRHFVVWCKARGLRPLPAHPWTLGAYARTCERRFPKGSMPARIQAIAKAHVLQGHTPPDRHPTVTGTLLAMESRARMQNYGSDLFPSDVTAADGQSPANGVETADGENAATVKKPRTLRQAPLLVPRRPPKA